MLNTSDGAGGAAIAANRLSQSLREAGVEVSMLVLNHQGKEPGLAAVRTKVWRRLPFLWERVVIWVNNLFSRKNLFRVSIANAGFDITKTREFHEADIIHLHWINQGFLSLKGVKKIFRSGKPVVWTMHDMWECTAICHQAYGCNAFQTGCRCCPFLRFPSKRDLSYRVFRKKEKVWQASTATFVPVSRWLAQQAGQSALLRGKKIEVIPNTLSLSNFELLDRTESRQRLSLPADRHIILFGAARVDDPIKGFPLLMQAIKYLIESGACRREDLHLLFFGQVKNEAEVYPLIPIEYTHVGWIDNPHEFSLLYSAANVTVSSSHYEAFGQTLIEAQACGCLPVSFGNSGQADIIRHRESGYLAGERSAEALAEGIRWAIDKGKNIARESLREAVVSRYSGEVVATQYKELYGKVINEYKHNMR